MMRGVRGIGAALLGAFAIAAPLPSFAQERGLPDRIAAPTRAAIDRLIDSVRASGIPSAPLVDKAAEGVLKGADDERILRAVRTLARELSEARTALDGTSDISILGAGASALHAGVSTAELHRIAHPSGKASEPRALASALVTLVDLVSKQVPVGVAASSIRLMLERGASERQFTALRGEVERDILAGRSPEASLAGRMRTSIPPP